MKFVFENVGNILVIKAPEQRNDHECQTDKKCAFYVQFQFSVPSFIRWAKGKRPLASKMTLVIFA
jgi:hypothetical protein